MTAGANGEKRRLLWLDFLKVVAILAVLYDHRAGYAMAQQISAYTGADLLLQAAATLTRTNVPLFFMVSGALLLGRTESIGFLFRHRVLRILIVMVLCTFLRGYPSWTAANFLDVFTSKLNWYLYAYLAYLLMLPLLRKLAQGLQERDAVYFLAWAAFIDAGLGFMAYFNQTNPVTAAPAPNTALLVFAPCFGTTFPSLAWGMMYPLAGYLLLRHGRILSSKAACRLYAGGAICFLLFSIVGITEVNRASMGTDVELLRAHGLLPASCLFFVWAQRLYENYPVLSYAWIAKFTKEQATCVFGIYIIETHTELKNFVEWNIAPQGIHTIWAALLSMLLQYVICFFITFLMKKVPGLRQIL